jgi:hypothetical protein
MFQEESEQIQVNNIDEIIINHINIRRRQRRREKGHQSGDVAAKLRNQSINPTREVEQGSHDINTLLSPHHLSR